MAITDFNFTPSNGWNDTTEFPDYPARDQVRPLLQKLFDQIKSFINGTIKTEVNNHLTSVTTYMTNVTYTPAVGSQKITIPFKAKSIKIDVINNSTNQISMGMWAENGQQGCVYYRPTANVYGNNSTNSVFLEDSTNNIVGNIQNVVDDGFDIAWSTTSGLLSGSLRIKILASTH